MIDYCVTADLYIALSRVSGMVIRTRTYKSASAFQRLVTYPIFQTT